MDSLFDPIADMYDQWYDLPKGKAIFQEELACLRVLQPDCAGDWLEVGVGTGRFAHAMGIQFGVDLSGPMLTKAFQRGIRTCVGTTEHLPFLSSAFDGVLLALTVCFLSDPTLAFQECARVLKPNGRLVLGILPGDGPWGREYIRKGHEGDPVYSHAQFRTVTEINHMVCSAGFQLQAGSSSLFCEPDDPPAEIFRLESGIAMDAGFVGLLFTAPPPLPESDRWFRSFPPIH